MGVFKAVEVRVRTSRYPDLVGEIKDRGHDPDTCTIIANDDNTLCITAEDGKVPFLKIHDRRWEEVSWKDRAMRFFGEKISHWEKQVAGLEAILDTNPACGISLTQDRIDFLRRQIDDFRNFRQDLLENE